MADENKDYFPSMVKVRIIMNILRESMKLVFSFQPMKIVLVINFILTSYYLLYVYWRFYPNDWNKRKSMTLSVSQSHELEKLHKLYGDPAVSSEITIVTAYFNLGSFAKGRHQQYTPSKYKRWMSVFGRLQNPLIVFTDSADTVDTFKIIREKFPINDTKIFLVKRESLWSFSIANQIKNIFNQPDYPEIFPNTVNENYSCVMHAKFELVNKVINENLIKTKFVSWLDIGLYRHFVEESHNFRIRLPQNFDISKVAYSQVKEFDSSLKPMEVVSGNLVWVGGAMFMGKYDTMYLYTQDYMESVKKLLSIKVMSTDQQVIYSMYLPSFKFRPRVELQMYTTHSGDDWFYLGYIVKDWWERHSIREPLSLLNFCFKLL
ncbi:hypothetical protein LOTGIDRAFT_157475 [Lottia gigantea]|uniref:Uncharacterized protein n=1 Tax=Lottia gigantea TaxID=225164 RepID=V4B1S3_LOTGI|nr:hypothetical protein LOTGIDRAFT_157475 [Lottia gigantea]ESP01296.1 hypothetical protein LOTGIDRAFT_157475 [Lottia gigantea]